LPVVVVEYAKARISRATVAPVLFVHEMKEFKVPSPRSSL
jgi:hypothetical protein